MCPCGHLAAGSWSLLWPAIFNVCINCKAEINGDYKRQIILILLPSEGKVGTIAEQLFGILPEFRISYRDLSTCVSICENQLGCLCQSSIAANISTLFMLGKVSTCLYILDKQRLWALLGEWPGEKHFHLFSLNTKKQQGVKYNHCHKHEKDGTLGKALGNQQKANIQSDAFYIIIYLSEKTHQKNYVILWYL